MLETIALLITVVLLVFGLAFMVVAAVGFTRLPDVFCRLHVTGILDTLGAPLVLLAVAVQLLPDLAALKLVLGLLFLLVTSPLVGHLLSRAALRAENEKPDAPRQTATPAAKSAGRTKPKRRCLQGAR